MMISLYLLGFAALVAIAAPRMLPGAAWIARAPRLGLAAWHTIVAVVALSVLGSVVSLIAGWHSTVDMVCAWWQWCAHMMTGMADDGTHPLAWTVLAIGAVFGIRALSGIRKTISEVSAYRREHAAMLHLVARPDQQLGALVVEHPQPAAYLLPGGGGQVVITSALRQLPTAQVAAVLAHERAHATGRHHLMLTTTRILAAAFPAVAAFTLAHRQVDRLVELCADDTATAEHRRLDLARALVACAEAAHDVPMPVGAAAAHGGDALERVCRLLNPPAPLSRTHRTVVAMSLLALLATPPSLVLLGLMFPALATCLPMN